MQMMLMVMKMKYTLLPKASIPMGHTRVAAIEAIEPPAAAKFRPRARTEVGNI